MKKNKTNQESCQTCDEHKFNINPDHSGELNRLNRMIGQLEAIKRMIEERAYCPDILIQTKAVRSAIKSLESSILEKHLKNCVADTFKAKNKKGINEKIQELMTIFKKMES